MLYEQQKKAGLTLAVLERKVAGLRDNFTRNLLQKNSWETVDSINTLFEKSEGLELSG